MKCKSCAIDKIEIPFFMLQDSVWSDVSNGDDLLCFNCIEERLGRKLTKRDFRPRAPIGGKIHNFWRANFTERDNPEAKEVMISLWKRILGR